MATDEIGPILGRVPSGIFILTATGEEGYETGMLASWVMQAGFEPPMVTVCVKQGRYVEEWLSAGRPFNLNVLSEDQKDLLGHFGRGFEPGEPAFEGLKVSRCSRGLPVLSDSIGWLECEPAESLTSGDHHIFLAQVTGGKLISEDRPMVHVRKSGLHY